MYEGKSAGRIVVIGGVGGKGGKQERGKKTEVSK